MVLATALESHGMGLHIQLGIDPTLGQVNRYVTCMSCAASCEPHGHLHASAHAGFFE